MITNEETLALLDEALHVKMEVLNAAPGKELERLKELLAETPPAYRRIIERIYLDGFDIAPVIVRVKARSEPAEKSPQQIALDWIARSLLGRVLLVVAVVVFTVWKVLPQSTQTTLLGTLFSAREDLLAVTIEAAGPVEILPGGATGKSPGSATYAFPLTLRLENPGDTPLRLEPGLLLLGARPEPCLTGLLLFATSSLGPHASRRESLRVELIPLRPADLPAGEIEHVSAGQIPAGWLRLPVLRDGDREEILMRELGPQKFLWIIPPATSARPAAGVRPTGKEN